MAASMDAASLSRPIQDLTINSRFTPAQKTANPTQGSTISHPPAQQTMTHISNPQLTAMRSRAQTCMLVLAWSLCSFTYGLLLSIVGPTAKLLAERTHSTPSDLAPVLGMGGICTLLGAMPSGWILDRVPGNPLLAAVLLLQALGYAVMPYCTSVPQLAVVFGVASLTFNFINTGLNAMVIWSFPDPQQLAGVLNCMSAVFGVAGILAPQMVTLAALTGDGSQCYTWTAACAVVSALLMVGLPSPRGHVPLQAPPTQHHQHQQHPPNTAYAPPHHVTAMGQGGTETQSLDNEVPRRSSSNPTLIVQGHAADGEEANTTSLLHSSKAQAPVSAPVGLVAGYRQPWGVLVPALLVVFANVSIELGFAAWIFTYAREVGGMDDISAENMTSLFWLLFVVGRVIAAVLATCVTPSALLLASMPLAVVGAAWPLISPGGSATVGSVVLVGLGASCGFPSTLSIAAQYARLDGNINGVISTVAGLSMTLMPALVPSLAKWNPQFGFSWLMVATLACALGQWAALALLLRAGAAQTRARAPRVLPVDDAEDLQAPLIVSSSNE